MMDCPRGFFFKNTNHLLCQWWFSGWAQYFRSYCRQVGQVEWRARAFIPLLNGCTTP